MICISLAIIISAEENITKQMGIVIELIILDN